MKILFASMPFDGHFGPLTGLAVYLKDKGHDVRWYTGPSYATRLADLGIPHCCFATARDVNAANLDELFPEYAKLGTGPKAIEFATTKLFFGNLEAHYRDVLALYPSFPFQVLICDVAFYAGTLVAQKLGPLLYVIGPGPTPAPTSKTAPPPFFGLRPASGPVGRLRDRLVRALVERSMRTGKKMLNDLLAREGLPRYDGSIFDLPLAHARRWFQAGVPGMDFPRDDFPANYRFVGPLLPHRPPRAASRAFEALEAKLAQYAAVIVVSQGTVDNRDPEKLIAPALEALRGGPQLVIATTGHRHTEALRRRFPEENVVVEDFIDFDAVLERADLFICNGGYGSVMQALVKGVPLLLAGKLEAKNDINARLDYRGLGLDLRTERPARAQIASGVARVLGDPRFTQNVARVRAELAAYRPFEIIERAIEADTPAR